MTKRDVSAHFWSVSAQRRHVESVQSQYVICLFGRYWGTFAQSRGSTSPKCSPVLEHAKRVGCAAFEAKEGHKADDIRLTRLDLT